MMNGTQKKVSSFFPEHHHRVIAKNNNAADGLAWRLIKSSFSAMFLWLIGLYNCMIYVMRKQYRNVSGFALEISINIFSF